MSIIYFTVLYILDETKLIFNNNTFFQNGTNNGSTTFILTTGQIGRHFTDKIG